MRVRNVRLCGCIYKGPLPRQPSCGDKGDDDDE